MKTGGAAAIWWSDPKSTLHMEFLGPTNFSSVLLYGQGYILIPIDSHGKIQSVNFS